MSFQSAFLIGVVVAFGGLFSVLMYAWIAVNLHQMKRPTPVAQATPARRPDPEPLKRVA
jgi:hypothetical protein